MADDPDDFLFGNLSLVCEPSTKRQTCQRCQRPASLCICYSFPIHPIPVHTNIIILQHPNERCRKLTTVPILQQCISPDKIQVLIGHRFNCEKLLCLKNALSGNSTILLYPGKNAIKLQSLPPCPIGRDDGSAVIILDGTWSEAQTLYYKNRFLQSLQQVKLCCEDTSVSKYVIRTQPSRSSLSTLESVAHALSWLEGNEEIVDELVYPLTELCKQQLDHGASYHFNKDDPNYTTRDEFKKQS